MDPLDQRAKLELIARMLGVSVSEFFQTAGSQSREMETLALVEAFDRISDGSARARCLALIRAEADRKTRD